MKPRVLFLCTGNSSRSQMAEGLLRHRAGEALEVASAGADPAGLNPLAVEAMKEVGIDISHHRSKGLAEVLDQRFEYVITVCDRARQSCPVFHEAVTTLHWSLEDPAEAEGSQEDRRRLFARVRDEIADRIEELLRSTRDGSGRARRSGALRRGSHPNP